MNHRNAGPGETFYARTFAVLTLIVVGLLVFRLLQPLLAPLLWAIFIAFLLQPLQRWLTVRLRCWEGVAALLLTVATLIIVIGPLAGLTAAFVAQFAKLLEAVQAFASTELDSTYDIIRLPLVGSLVSWVQEAAGVSWAELQEWMAEGAKQGLKLLAPFGGRLFLGALGTAVSFVITMFTLFFFLRDGKRMLAIGRGLIPMPEADKGRLFKHLADVLRAVVYGTVLTALIQGALVGIGFWIVHLPAPLVFAALAVLFALLPAAGTPLVWVPAVVVLVAQERWGAGVFLLLWGLMLSTVDNLIRPYLVAGRADVGTLAVFIGVLGGIISFGAAGLFIGPFILALLVALVRFTLEMRAENFGDPPPPPPPVTDEMP